MPQVTAADYNRQVYMNCYTVYIAYPNAIVINERYTSLFLPLSLSRFFFSLYLFPCLELRLLVAKRCSRLRCG